MTVLSVKLMGGLGNQLFQYAAGRAAALRAGADFRLDLSWFEAAASADTPRDYALAPFNVRESFLPPAVGLRARAFGRPGRLGRALRRFLPGLVPGGRTVEERQSGTYEPIPSVSGDARLVGYWQSEKYFSDTAGLIREEFALKEEGKLLETEIARKIRGESGAVSLHVRRGDYVTNPKANAVHGTCAPEYYAAALSLIESQVREPHVFVFSDDIEWFRRNVRTEIPVTLVSDGRLRDFEELRLMSYCRHHVIANSSFSWWGAWLDPNPDKVVVAPERWFAGRESYRDIVPEGWVRI